MSAKAPARSPTGSGRRRGGIVVAMPGAGLDIETTDSGVLVVSGEIDAHSAPVLESHLASLPSGDVVLDMSGVSFIDSSGLRVLVSEQQRRAAGGLQFAVVDPSVSVERLFAMVGLVELFVAPAADPGHND
jgi:anti-sigma B factor antagonist